MDQSFHHAKRCPHIDTTCHPSSRVAVTAEHFAPSVTRWVGGWVSGWGRVKGREGGGKEGWRVEGGGRRGGTRGGTKGEGQRDPTRLPKISHGRQCGHTPCGHRQPCLVSRSVTKPFREIHDLFGWLWSIVCGFQKQGSSGFGDGLGTLFTSNLHCDRAVTQHYGAHEVSDLFSEGDPLTRKPSDHTHTMLPSRTIYSQHLPETGARMVSTAMSSIKSERFTGVGRSPVRASTHDSPLKTREVPIKWSTQGPGPGSSPPSTHSKRWSRIIRHCHPTWPSIDEHG